MREWCRVLSKPEHCYWYRSTANLTGARCGGRSSRSHPSWPIVAKMEDAGLIEWQEPGLGLTGRPERRAALTAAGLAAIAGAKS